MSVRGKVRLYSFFRRRDGERNEQAKERLRWSVVIRWRNGSGTGEEVELERGGLRLNPVPRESEQNHRKTELGLCSAQSREVLQVKRKAALTGRQNRQRGAGKLDKRHFSATGGGLKMIENKTKGRWSLAGQGFRALVPRIYLQGAKKKKLTMITLRSSYKTLSCYADALVKPGTDCGSGSRGHLGIAT